MNYHTHFLIVDTNNIDFVGNKEDYKKIKELIFKGNYKKGINQIAI